MTRLKLSDIIDDKPVKITIEIPVRLHRELTTYAVVLNGGDAKNAPSPDKLIPPMIERFISSDRAFAKARRSVQEVENEG
ncbi:MAG: DUF2274 domain-containing protein [Novosphingobium sp.]|jgi:hypothetical protein|uniref:Uncharacterized protein n=1 Tax=Croceibacterium atlanticum TaxID=1267766 RepID=A0A0F7KVL4_9SPHN|nr:DUF2274 domain-containing protein [Croceibacterium atlanticum]AKH43724.1 hypothetical protein WYH_02694 [Croceibacterium atlanticum]MAC59902.1 DUF2274 domain-containing protein [Novosphingobium sp.]MBB5734265.1 hypothetical protein [Croceibacterium atlanticum]TNE41069.1 MAG: DUF2274 domain-containing protein [Sphingomonadales bacterium]